MKQIEKGGRSIFKVPLSIKKLQTDAFVAHIVSIGPYHWHEKHLMEMETCKSILLGHVLNRAGMQLPTLKVIMYELEAATRKHYDQPFKNIKRGDFVKMMLRDACFTLELFCIEADGWEKYGYSSDPYVRLNMTGFMPFVRRDLLMLENQSPLSVLQKMFTVLDWKQITPNESIRSLAIKFSRNSYLGFPKIDHHHQQQKKKIDHDRHQQQKNIDYHAHEQQQQKIDHHTHRHPIQKTDHHHHQHQHQHHHHHHHRHHHHHHHAFTFLTLFKSP
ncbi:unnamed protein product [Camellia sinensis]